MGERRVVVEGTGLHTGAPARVTLEAREGPVVLRQGGIEAQVADLSVVRSPRCTAVEARGGALRIATVEHALAALAGLGIRRGVVLHVEGPELPLLDGGALAWCEALDRLGLPPVAPAVRVARQGSVEVGASRYDFVPGDRSEVEVRVEFDGVTIEPEARWDGSARDFRLRIAPARTFALARELATLSEGGLARHAPPDAVVVLTPDGALWAGPPFSPDEPARHKLLDLVGDLFLCGGPPLGRVRALRPGHAATAQATHRALAEGLLAPA